LIDGYHRGFGRLNRHGNDQGGSFNVRFRIVMMDEGFRREGHYEQSCRGNDYLLIHFMILPRWELDSVQGEFYNAPRKKSRQPRLIMADNLVTLPHNGQHVSLKEIRAEADEV
jgi:hypothetical protein